MQLYVSLQYVYSTVDKKHYNILETTEYYHKTSVH